MVVTQQLKDAIQKSELTHYAIGKETGIDTRTLDRLMGSEEYQIRSGTFDALCEFFGLELHSKKRTTAGKQAKKKPATTRKKRAK